MQQGLLTLYVGNQSVIELTGLTDALTGNIQQAASVRVSLMRAASEQVVGQQWPTTMHPVPGCPGSYRATLDAALAVVPCEQYTAVVDVDSAGVVARWDVPVIARKRVR